MTGQELIGHVGATLLDSVWQCALIGLEAACAMIGLRRARPQTRYAVACVHLLLCLLWPVVELTARLNGGAAGASGAPVLVQMLPGVGDAGSGGLHGFLQAHLSWLVAGWAACAAALGLRMALGLVWIGRAARVQRTDAHWNAKTGDDGDAVRHHARRAPARGRCAGQSRHGRLVASGGAGAGLAGVGHAAAAAGGPAGARTGPCAPLRLPGQPGAERDRNSVVLPPRGLVALAPHPCRARTDRGRYRGKATGRTAAPGPCAFRAGTSPVLNPPPGPGGQRRRSHVTYQTTGSSRNASTELESRASSAGHGGGLPGRLRRDGAAATTHSNTMPAS